MPNCDVYFPGQRADPPDRLIRAKRLTESFLKMRVTSMHYRNSRPRRVRWQCLSLAIFRVRDSARAAFRVLPVISAIIVASLFWTAYNSIAAESELRILERSESIQLLLQQANALEQKKKWDEALSLYEGAIKRYPDEQTLYRCQETARIHYDLSRRYLDHSYRTTLTSLSPQEARELFAEILLKVDSHYVKPMDWEILVDRGTRCVEIALKEKTFIEQNLHGKTPTSVDTTMSRLRTFIGSRSINNRQDAQAVVGAAALLVATDMQMAPTAIILEYVAGAAGGLDPYSTYLTGNQLKDVYSQIDGNFVGIGIEVKYRVMIGEATVDSEAKFFLADDRSSEMWSITTTRRQPPSAQNPKGLPVTFVETGVLETPAPDALQLRITLEGPTGSKTMRHPLPPVGYLSRVEAHLLGQLLPIDEPATYGLFWYHSNKRHIAYRTENLTPTRSGHKIQTHLSPNDPALTTTYDRKRKITAKQLSDQVRLVPAHPKMIQQRWKLR